jgi:hypothetical protein
VSIYGFLLGEIFHFWDFLMMSDQPTEVLPQGIPDRLTTFMSEFNILKLLFNLEKSCFQFLIYFSLFAGFFVVL